MPTELPENTDVTLATEVSDGLPASLIEGGALPGAHGSPEDDHTAFADPVEQAILVDRTRLPRHSGEGRVPVAPAASATGGDVTSLTGDATAINVRSTAEDPGDGLFGNYRVVAPLVGRGRGPLLLAEHTSLGFPVAIKVLPPALVGSVEAENRFFAEAMVASRIAHPGIPMVLDFGYDQRGIGYLAMEYLEGETLGAHLAGGSLFSLDQVLEIGAQTAGILAAAHASGIAHGELSSTSIHICPDPSEPSGLRVKLLDLGAAAFAPDQPAEFGDALADMYGLGCALYHLLAGRPPFIGSPEEVAHALATQDPPPPCVHRPDIPPPLDAMVYQMVARRPEDRPVSMAAVERQLRALMVGHHPMGGAPPSHLRPLTWHWQSLRGWWRAAGTALSARWRQTADLVGELVMQHPRWSAAVIAAVLFVGALGLALLVS